MRCLNYTSSRQTCRNIKKKSLNNQDGKKNEEEIARYVCSRFWNETKFMKVCGVCLVKISYKLAES